MNASQARRCQEFSKSDTPISPIAWLEILHKRIEAAARNDQGYLKNPYAGPSIPLPTEEDEKYIFASLNNEGYLVCYRDGVLHIVWDADLKYQMKRDMVVARDMPYLQSDLTGEYWK